MAIVELFGRRQIFCDEPITLDNVVSILSDALVIHLTNHSQIDYLYQYYKGRQPILDRTKEVRPEICNKIVVNRANEIVSFKDGYLIGEPVQYISRGENDSKSDEINTLNGYMNMANKAAEDMDLVNWMHICGVGYRLVLPNKGDKEQPFSIHTLDPRHTFVVYLNDVAKTPQMAVTTVIKEDGTAVHSCYLKDMSFKVTAGLPMNMALGVTQIDMGSIVYYSSPILPIVEYVANKERMGAFETVISMLDAISLTESNRLDGIEQFVQSLMVFVNTDISEEQLNELKSSGAIKIFSGDGKVADVKYLISELNQEQTQVLADDMYDTVLTICGMPNRNGGSSTSDTGSAVLLRDGWSSAEGRAKTTELYFSKSERQSLKLVCNLVRVNTGLELTASDVEIKFTRRNYENLTIKVNALVAMLNNGKIDPLDAYQASGLFIDPEAAYIRGNAYFEANKTAGTEGNDGNAIANTGTGNPGDS